MTGLARVIRGHMVTAFENVSLWHERDISHSSAERIIAPTRPSSSTTCSTAGNIVKNLTIFSQKTWSGNMNLTFGLIFSQRLCWPWLKKAWRERRFMIWCSQRRPVLGHQVDSCFAWSGPSHFLSDSGRDWWNFFQLYLPHQARRWNLLQTRRLRLNIDEANEKRTKTCCA